MLKFLSRALGGKSGQFGVTERPIIISKSVMDTWPDDPHILTDAVSDFVTHLQMNGRFTRDEINPSAIQTYQCVRYLALVSNGGHAEFVGNSHALIDQTLEDIQVGLEAMGAKNFLEFVRKTAKWVRKNPKKIAEQSADNAAPQLAALDTAFFDLHRQNPLTKHMANWISRHPDLKVIPNVDLAKEIETLIEQNPKRAFRDICMQIASLENRLTSQPLVGFSLATGAISPPDPILHVGAGDMMDVEGDSRKTYVLRTALGSYWGVVQKDHVGIYERVEHNREDMLESLEDKSVDDILQWHAPEVGAKVAITYNEAAHQAAQAAKKLHAAAAIQLLLNDLSDPATLDFATLRSVGSDENGMMTLSVLLVLNKATLALTAVVSEKGATLLTEPGHNVVAEASARHVEAFARLHRLDAAA